MLCCSTDKVYPNNAIGACPPTLIHGYGTRIMSPKVSWGTLFNLSLFLHFYTIGNELDARGFS